MHLIKLLHFFFFLKKHVSCASFSILSVLICIKYEGRWTLEPLEQQLFEVSGVCCSSATGHWRGTEFNKTTGQTEGFAVGSHFVILKSFFFLTGFSLSYQQPWMMLIAKHHTVFFFLFQNNLYTSVTHIFMQKVDSFYCSPAIVMIA